jgi:polar amino acid transport system permease protein
MVIYENLRFLLIGPYPHGPIGGLLLTLILSVMVGAGSLAVGVFLASLSLSPSRPVRFLAQFLPTLIRSLPSLVFLFWMYFLLPAMLGVQMSPLQSAAIALSIYQGSFIAEDLRGGLNAVGKGQAEAGAASGLSPMTVFWHISLPQAIRATVPALVNRYINMFLYTSTASVVGVMEFTGTSMLVNNRVMVHPIQIFGFAAIVYFVFCYGLGSFGRYLERRWNWAPKITRSATAI